MFHTRNLLLTLIVLLASCGTVRRLAMPANEEASALSIPEQRKYEYYFLEAIRLEQQRHYDEAYDMLQHCLAICPTASSALYKMATYHFAMNQKEKASEALLLAVELAPDNYWYHQTLASYYQGNREFDKAIAVIEEMQTKFPKRNGELLPALVNLYSHTGQYDKVIDALNRLEVIAGKSEAISMEKMRNYLLMGNKEGAFDEMEALAAEYPDNSYYQVILAEVYMDYERADEAEPILLDVLSKEPDNGLAKIALAEYYQQKPDTARYLAMAEAVVTSTEVSEEYKVRLMAQLITENSDSIWVMELFERAIALPQQSARLSHLCAQYMLHLQQPEERIRPILLRILEIEPDHIPARNQLLSYAALRDDIEEMVDICSDGINYNPEVLDYYYYKGIGLHHYMDRTNEALETYRQAIRQISESSDAGMVSDIYCEMGNLLQTKGETNEAYTCYDEALKYNPSNLLALNNYAYFLSEEERELEKAEQMSRITINEAPDNATYLDTYAWIMYKMRRYDEAYTYIKQALENEPDPSSELYEHAGDIYYRMGHKTMALYYWRQAYDLQQETGSVDENLKKKIKTKKL